MPQRYISATEARNIAAEAAKDELRIPSEAGWRCTSAYARLSRRGGVLVYRVEITWEKRSRLVRGAAASLIVDVDPHDGQVVGFE